MSSLKLQEILSFIRRTASGDSHLWTRYSALLTEWRKRGFIEEQIDSPRETILFLQRIFKERNN